MKLSEHIEITNTHYWVWPSVIFRLNSGGYLHGTQPYKEFAIGPFRLRRYI